MNDDHLSQQDQEAYVLGEKNPNQARHMAICPACRASVARLEYGIARFRKSSLQWAEECMETHLGHAPKLEAARAAKIPAPQLGLAFAAVLALAAFLLHPWTAPVPSHSTMPAAMLSDDALLEQVDAQLAAPVPDSMHSLTHLVSANNSNGSTQHE